jgi:hypothetical protein
MNQYIFLYTLPQWLVFAGIISSVYGWVEHKKVFRMLGPVLFFSLGLFSVFILLGDYFSAARFLTPEEMVNLEMEEELLEELPFQARLLPAYLFFIITGLLAIPAFLLEWKDRKGKNLLIVITAFVSLMGFFTIVGALRNL